MFEQIAVYTGTIGLLAFIVSVIIEVIKEIPTLDKLPTDAVVLVLSFVVTQITYFAYVSIQGLPVIWYQVVGTFIGGFIVAFVAMFGWEKLSELWQRFNKE